MNVAAGLATIGVGAVAANEAAKMFGLTTTSALPYINGNPTTFNKVVYTAGAVCLLYAGIKTLKGCITA